MSTAVETRLAELGVVLPLKCEPRGLFLPWTKVGNLVYLAGQICERDGEVEAQGRVGVDIAIDTARRAARICATNLLFHLRDACSGDLERVVRCVRVGAFVNAPEGFRDSPKVADGASEVFIALWGDAGRHVRTAVGVAALPANASVEIDAIFEIQSAHETAWEW